MKTKKKVLVLVLVVLLVATTITPAFAASGSIGVLFSDPATIRVYFPNTWSNVATWDLRNWPTIPDHAVVTSVYFYWDTIPAYGYSGMNVALFKEGGYGYYMQNAASDYRFAGQPVKQLWSSQFWVELWSSPGNPLYVAHKLAIVYEY